MPAREQRTLLKFLRANPGPAGAAPSFREVRNAHAQLETAVHPLTAAFDKGGPPGHPPNRNRAINAAKQPGRLEVENVTFDPAIRRCGKFGHATFTVWRAIASSAPVIGSIPVESPATTTSRSHPGVVSGFTAPRKDRHRAMAVKDGSMASAGIIDADIVAVREHGAAGNGNIAAGPSMTGRRCRAFRGGAIGLEFANPARGGLLFPPERIMALVVSRDSSATIGEFPAAVEKPAKRNEPNAAIMRRRHPGNTRSEGARDKKLNRRNPVRGDVSRWIPPRIAPPSWFGGARGSFKILPQIINKPMPARLGGGGVFDIEVVETSGRACLSPCGGTRRAPNFGRARSSWEGEWK